jgi:alginate O-acetyltransferase complex protein AlgJ
MRSALRRRLDALLVLAFAAGLLAPTVDQFVRPASARDTKTEMRAPAPAPAAPKSLDELAKLPRKVDAWYEDHFGLRDVFLRWHNAFKWFALHTSPTPKLVLGEGGWVFTSEAMALDDYRGAVPLSPGALEAWRRLLEQRRAWFAARGIEYMFVVAPYKTHVYPELLGPRFEPLGPSRTDQLAAHLERTSDFRIVDLRAAVVAARAQDKPDDPTFYPFGTHWTDRGAYAGYVELVNAIGKRLPGIAPLPPDAFEARPVDSEGDSWAGRLYLDGLLPQPNIEWSVREPKARFTGNFREDPVFVSEREGGGPRALVFHDSFTLPLRPWLAEHFSRLYCDWTHTPIPERIEAEKPDLVIQIYNGYTLMQLTPHALREEDAGARAKRFDAASQVLWRFDAARFPDGLSANLGAKLALDGGVLTFEREAPASLLFLPELDYPADADLLVACELESSEAGKLQVLYCTERLPRIDRRQYVETVRAAGRERVVLEVPQARFVGRSALWLGPRRGVTKIHSLEVRAAPVRN